MLYFLRTKEQLENGILFIPSADPGYDWIFSHNIAGLITNMVVLILTWLFAQVSWAFQL